MFKTNITNRIFSKVIIASILIAGIVSTLATVSEPGDFYAGMVAGSIFVLIIFLFWRDKKIRKHTRNFRNYFSDRFPGTSAFFSIIFRIFTYIAFVASLVIICAASWHIYEQRWVEDKTILPPKETSYNTEKVRDDVVIAKEPIKSHDTRFEVTHVENLGQKLQDAETSSGKYLHFTLTVVNLSKKLHTLKVWPTKLKDQKGRKFELHFLTSEEKLVKPSLLPEDTGEENWMIDHNSNISYDLKPSIPKTIHLVAEAAQKSQWKKVSLEINKNPLPSPPGGIQPVPGPHPGFQQ